MTPTPPANPEETIFTRAVALPAAERGGYLEQACAGDAALRGRVEELLRVDDEAGFMAEPAAGLAPTVARLASLPDLSAIALAKAEEKPGDRIGRYKLLQKIGEGGCGTVYMAEQQEPVVRRVALKVIKLGMDTKEVIARFEAERQALALMDHANIARVFDAGATDTGRPFFVMELVRGVPITKYCDEQNLPTTARLELFTQVCHAVQHAHQKGIIHRDLKPSNILVTINDAVPVPKVIDFGIAKATQGRLTDSTVFTAFEQFIGTPAYMSPEQAVMTSLDVDTRSDIYSLGVLLYELLTGRTPFDSKTLVAAGLDEIRRVIREVDPPRPSTRLSTLTDLDRATIARQHGTVPAQLSALLRGDLDWIVMKALEKDRTRRYETANALALDLLRHLHDEPVAARPPTAAYRLQKMVRRNRLVFGAAAAIVASLVLGLGVSTWRYFQERAARQRAVVAEQQARTERDAAESARRAEQQARQLAEQRRKETETARANESRLRQQVSHQLAHQLVDKGVLRLEEGDYLGSLVWFAEALRSDEGNPAAEAIHRLRLGNVLRASPAPRQLFDHKEWVFSAELSPDGRRMVTAGNFKSARIWNVETGAVSVPALEHAGGVVCASFSSDGHRVVTASFDHTARVWDAQTGRPLSPPMTHEDSVLFAAFSSDGVRVVTASADHTARVWDAASGQPVTPPLLHEEAVWPAAFSPDGRLVATASWDKTARIWDAATGQMTTPPLQHGGKVWWVAFSPDGRLVTTASEDRSARIWDVHTGTLVAPPLQHSEEVVFVAFSPDGSRVVTASGENVFTGLFKYKDLKGEVRIWEVATGRPLTPPMPHKLSVSCAVFSPDGRTVVTASRDKTARVWDVKTGEPITPPLLHGDDVFRASFTADGRRIVTASFDGAARIWDILGDQQSSIALKDSWLAGGFRISSDGRLIAGKYFQGSARVWSAFSGTPITPRLQPDTNANHVAFSPDSRLVAAAADDAARMWDSHTGVMVAPPMPHEGKVRWIEFSPDGQRVVTASEDKTARVWSVRTGAPLTSPLQHSGPVLCVGFSPDGRSVVTASEDKTARIWDSATGAAITPPMSHGDGVKLVAFSPTGSRVLTATWDGRTRVWDALTGMPVTPPMKQGGRLLMLSGIESMAFSPDGHRIVIADSHKIARVWDAETGTPVTQPLRHTAEVFYAAFSHNGRYVVTASKDKTARVWDATTGQALTVPLKHNSAVNYALFTPDDSVVRTVSYDRETREFQIWSWDLSPDNRSAKEVLLLAEALSLQRLDLSGTLVPLNSEERSKAWRSLHQR